MKIHKPDEIHIVLTYDELDTLYSLLRWFADTKVGGVQTISERRLRGYHNFASLLRTAIEATATLDRGSGSNYKTPEDCLVGEKD